MSAGLSFLAPQEILLLARLKAENIAEAIMVTNIMNARDNYGRDWAEGEHPLERMQKDVKRLLELLEVLNFNRKADADRERFANPMLPNEGVTS